MHTATTTTCTVGIDAGLKITNGTTRKRPVTTVVIRRPRMLEMVAELWGEELSALPRAPCASTPLVRQRLDSLQYLKSRRSLWIQCDTGSARDRGGRSSLKSLVSYISGNVRSVRALAAFSSSNREHLSMAMMLLKADRASSEYSGK